MRFFVALMIALFLMPLQAQAEEAPYKLRAGDVVDIWVGQDTDLNRQIIVQPDGRISLPLAGHMQAEGLTLEELEKSLTDRLQKNFREPLDLTVMLAKTEQPPQAASDNTIYIVGDVAHPGAYPVRPGMTILHAISLAGGYARADQPSPTASNRADLATAQRELIQLLVQEARINAEIDGKDTIALPEDVTATTDSLLLADVVRSQSLTLDVRRGNRLAESEGRERTRSALTAQISALRAQIDLNQQELDLRKQDLERFRALMAKGLTAANGESDLLRAILGPQSRREQLSADLIQAQAKLEDLDATAKQAETQGRYDLLTQLEDTKRQVTDLRERIATMQGPQASQEATPQLVSIEYIILRPKGDSMESIPAEELTKVEPGDLIKVIWRVNAATNGAPTDSTAAGSANSSFSASR